MRLLENIFNDIQFKGDKANIKIKWILKIAIFVIMCAFIIGQFIVHYQNKLNNIEILAIESIEIAETLEKKMKDDLNKQNIKIDKIYDDGIEAFNKYRNFNNEQMKLIIDYGEDNKELLKKMLKLNSDEYIINFENNIQSLKRHDINDILDSFNDASYKNNPFDSIYPSQIKLIEPNIAIFTEIESGRKTYYVLNAPKNYIDTLNLNQYEIIEISKSKTYMGLYNFIYKNKLNN